MLNLLETASAVNFNLFKNNLKRKQMENKYFTPDIEDICIGYEYEKYSIGLQMVYGRFLPDNERDDELKWRPNIIKCGSDILGLEAGSYPNEDEPYKAFKTLWKDYIRVPYLTKEQIEAEGWKQISSEILTHGYFLKGECRLELLEDSIICIRNGYWYPENTIYKGECKDINTFRKIIKLLGI
jgi:hypothetical protein